MMHLASKIIVRRNTQKVETLRAIGSLYSEKLIVKSKSWIITGRRKQLKEFPYGNWKTKLMETQPIPTGRWHIAPGSSNPESVYTLHSYMKIMKGIVFKWIIFCRFLKHKKKIQILINWSYKMFSKQCTQMNRIISLKSKAKTAHGFST